MVRLIVKAKVQAYASLTSFNSKMVRLIDGIKYFDVSATDKFQFQNGSIDRIGWLLPLGTIELFQFQNGSIDRIIAVLFYSEVTEVSIPKWFD